MAESERKLRKRKTWRCFFCDEVFRSRKSAYEHFGEQGCESDPPACIDPLRHDEKQRMKELREARDYATQCQNEAQRAEERADSVEMENANFFVYFGKDCGNMWQAGDRYKNAMFELKMLREKAGEVQGG